MSISHITKEEMMSHNHQNCITAETIEYGNALTVKF